jgi:hypothetical protein
MLLYKLSSESILLICFIYMLTLLEIFQCFLMNFIKEGHSLLKNAWQVTVKCHISFDSGST